MSHVSIWKRGESRGSYRLMPKEGGKSKGTLTFQNWYGSEAVTATQQGGWRFVRDGWWKQDVEILEGGTVKGVFHPNWTSNGTLTMGERTYKWTAGNMWGTRWSWLDENGKPVLTFTMRCGFHASAAVEGAFVSREQAMLASLGWYLLLLYTRDMAALVPVLIFPSLLAAGQL